MAQDPRALLQKVRTARSRDVNHVIDFYSQADKAGQGAGSGFSFFGGRTEKWETAADLYSQAANAFRMQRQGMRNHIRPSSILQSSILYPVSAGTSLTGALSGRQRSRPCLRKRRRHPKLQAERARRRIEHPRRSLEVVPQNGPRGRRAVLTTSHTALHG